MRRLLMLLAICGIFLVALASPTYASATTTTTVLSVPISANLGGCTEVVSIVGTYRIVIHDTLDGAGGSHSFIVNAAQGISGVGLTTGTTYRVGEGLHSGINEGSGGLPYETTLTDTFHMVGQGAAGNNFAVQTLFHMIINPDGTVTSYRYDISAACTP